MKNVLDVVNGWVTDGSDVALATVVDTKKSAPQPAGTKMAVNAEGDLIGAVSGGCVEGNVVQVAEKILKGDDPQLLHYGIADDDAARYQTVYAREKGSVAAPTAGLHFTPEILARMKGRGIETAEVTLHVGLGTFQPVREERVEDHRLHRESYSVSGEAASAINRALDAGRRVVTVGTTTVRTLEYSALKSGRVTAGSGEADIFIYPGFEFRVVGALLTNFHLPQSTLLMLVCAFGGRQPVLEAYRHAVAGRYRFYSYGDCMFVE